MDWSFVSIRERVAQFGWIKLPISITGNDVLVAAHIFTLSFNSVLYISYYIISFHEYIFNIYLIYHQDKSKKYWQLYDYLNQSIYTHIPCTIFYNIFSKVLYRVQSKFSWDLDHLETISESSTNIATMDNSVRLEVSFETQMVISWLLHSASFVEYVSTKSLLMEPPMKLHLIYKIKHNH